MGSAARLRMPNLVLTFLRELSGYSQQDLADRLTEAAARRGDRHTVCDARMVRRWEAGEVAWPQDRYRALLEDVFARPVSDLGFVRRWTRTSAGWSLVAHTGGQAMSVPALDETVIVGEFLGLSFGFSAAADMPGEQRWLLAEAGTAAGGELPRRIGLDHVAQTEALSARLNSLDHRGGGGSLLRQAVNGVRAARLLLAHARYSREVGSRLEIATGEMLIQAGWLAYDAALQPLARRLYAEAVVMAKMAGHRQLAAHAFSNMSIQANALGHPQDAVQLAEAAAQHAAGWATPRVRAVFAMHLARGLASLGADAPCQRALAVSTSSFDAGSREADPGWIGYLNEDELATLTGVCLMDLGHAEAADRELARACGGGSLDVFARNRSSTVTFYIRNLLRRGEVDHACAVGGTLMPGVFGLSSSRILNQLQRFCDELQPYSGLPAPQQFLDAVTHATTGRASR